MRKFREERKYLINQAVQLNSLQLNSFHNFQFVFNYFVKKVLKFFFRRPRYIILLIFNTFFLHNLRPKTKGDLDLFYLFDLKPCVQIKCDVIVETAETRRPLRIYEDQASR